ncbi:T9SS type B sorting domain-containing protein [uncultured Flavobacterium sp.]|uniref:T9SS type B sorting domain-containing protein n=1 Tax=uncultured Flavobacterium sp. TaxID=165435 RepID=UPI0025DEEFFA|nr:T9SS type B sorting domain-containing protein [uncultured Flavobacterium sp.]
MTSKISKFTAVFKKSACILLLLCSCSILAQKEAANWYFGDKAGLDFNSLTPVALLNGQLNTNEGSASISNGDGVLRFYTDGTTVYNRNHRQMQNGDGLLGNLSSTQSAMIIPVPGNLTKYYIFTVPAESAPAGLNYSEVDMTLDGGLGAITANKNIRLDAPFLVSEKITAVRHTDGERFWVVSHRMDSNSFIAFLVSSTGIQTTPVISSVGRFTGAGGRASIGYLKASPDGKKLASAKQNISPDVELFDFDASTGIVSNPMRLDNSGAYGLEFSPDSKRLYFTVFSSDIYQFDVTLPTESTISASKTLIATGNYASLQLALDGKIYATKNDGSKNGTLAVINSPNSLGTACNFQEVGPSLGGRKSILGLPPFIQSFFKQEIKAEQFCLGNPTKFSITINANITSATWNFGDGNSSTAINPMHTFSAPGTYPVTVDFFIDANSNVIHLKKDITILPAPKATKPDDMKECALSGVATTFNLALQNNAILNGQNATDYTVTYYASPADLASGNAITSVTHSIASQTIIAKVTGTGNSCFGLTEFDVIRIEKPVVKNKKNLEACGAGATNGNFNLTENTSLILGSQSNVTFQVLYYTSQSLAEAGVLGTEITATNPYNSGNTTIYARIFNRSYSKCYEVTSFTLSVLQNPQLNSTVDIKFCEPNSTGFHQFILSDYYNQIVADQNGSAYTFKFYYDQTALNAGTELPNRYTNQIRSNQTIIVVVKNSAGCTSQGTVRLLVEPQPIANLVTSLFRKCDDFGNNDGIAITDISIAKTEVLGSQNASDHKITFHRTRLDAEGNANAISDLVNYENRIPYNDVVWVRIENLIVSGCPAYTNFPVKIDGRPIPKLDPGTICVDFKTNAVLRTYTLNSHLDNSHTFKWFRDGQEIIGASGSTYLASIAGNYSVVATNAIGCVSDNSASVKVEISGPAVPIGIGYTVTNAFSENQVIVINVEGHGEYAYQLDNNGWQSSNVFNNVSSGTHVVNVKDISTDDPCDGPGFDIQIKDIKVLTYPKYFTPNQDGYHDTWNIFPLSKEQPDAKIYIFDRLGKFIKQISPAGQGWDGTYNGKPLPSTDYWFKIIYKENNNLAEFRAHFSLKR